MTKEDTITDRIILETITNSLENYVRLLQSRIDIADDRYVASAISSISIANQFIKHRLDYQP